MKKAHLVIDLRREILASEFVQCRRYKIEANVQVIVAEKEGFEAARRKAFR